MATNTATHATDSASRAITFGKVIGRGAEGTIFEVVGRRDLVAKIYHQPPEERHARKLKAMTGLATSQLQKVAAWPVDTLHAGPSGHITGILMPHAGKRKPIYQLYNPQSRLKEFPGHDWRFLIQAAENLAIAMHTVHQDGHIIGDVNEQNVLVGTDAKVYLIDCDSFQIAKSNTVYTCDLGVLNFTPPELQGKHLRDLKRTRNHDYFGLAVLIFQLLCMGRHPFSGRYLGSGDMPIERAIREFRYSYGSDSASKQMQAPPGAVPVSAIPSNVRGLFDRAFSRSGSKPGGRPDTESWIAALRNARTNLQKCGTVDSHVHVKGDHGCVWCHLSKNTGTDFFPGPGTKSDPRPGPETSGLDLDAAWKRIKNVSPPSEPGDLKTPGDWHMAPAAQAVDNGNIRKERQGKFLSLAVPIALISGCTLLLFAQTLGSGFTASIAILGGLIFLISMHLYSNSEIEHVRSKYSGELQSARSRYDEWLEKWIEQASQKRFEDEVKRLERQFDDYKRLQQEREQRKQDREAELRERHFESFMKRHHIVDGIVPGIGAGRVATLHSHGIKSAWDISEEKILDVPGFGETLAASLDAWRDSVERRYKRDRSTGLTASDHRKIEAEFKPRFARIEKDLLNGETRLKQIRKEIQQAQRDLRSELDKRSKELAQAEANWNAL